MQNLQAFYFGLVVALSIGPGALIILNRGVQHGFKSAAYSGLGAAAGDFVYGFLAFSAGGWIAQLLLPTQDFLRIISGSFLMAISIYIIAVSSRRHVSPNDEDFSAKQRSLNGDCLSLFAMTLSNPLTIVIFLGFMGNIQGQHKPFNALMYAIFVFLGSLIVQSAIALSGVYLGNWLKQPIYIRYFNRASAVGIFLFGLKNVI